MDKHDTDKTEAASVLRPAAGSRLFSYHIGKAINLNTLEASQELFTEVEHSELVLTDLVSNGSTKFIHCENTEVRRERSELS